MFDHVTIRASDRTASERFFDTVLATIGVGKSASGEHYAEWGDFSLAEATGEKPVTRRLHIAFAAPSQGHVDVFWRTGVEAGYREDGEPGPRPQYSPSYYGSFLLDPDGNSVEAVHHDVERHGIDHLWIRVRDVEAAARFYQRLAPHAGYRLGEQRADFAHFDGEDGSFSLVAGVPTEHVHLAFPVAANAAVDAFHRDLTGAGYEDNGAPGDRPSYHPGYYAAFVLDPDGNNVELVNHNR